MGQVLGMCAGLFGLGDDDAIIESAEVDERMAVEQLLHDVAGEGYAVEITIECRGLPDKDKFSKSDPFVLAKVPTKHREGDDDLQRLGRTETVQNNLNPMFITAIMDTFSTSEDHEIHFFAYHESNPALKEDDQQLLGNCTVTLGSLVEASPSSVEIPLQHPSNINKKAGTIVLTAQKALNVQEEITIKISAQNLRFSRGTPNAFLTINRVQKNRLIPVAKSNVVRSAEPAWNAIRVKAYRLCKNDDDLPLQLQVFSYDPQGAHISIGACKASLAALMSGGLNVYPIVNELKIGRSDYTNSGELIINEVTRSAPYGFLDYVKKGFEINCTLAVDLSASNGMSARSLHFLDPANPLGSPNDYIQAIRRVCRVVGRYDKDQMFPVYGFGASTDGHKQNHCFPLSLDEDATEVQGAANIVAAYVNCMRLVKPREPTFLAPVIRQVMKSAETSGQEDIPSYQLLVIFTDGRIDDMTETEHAMVEASALPMSILIVGMGQPDKQREGFEKMERLDNSELHSVISGAKMKRDVVNFIVYNEFKKESTTEFARGALAEVPRHFLSWVAMTGFNIEEMKAVGSTENESAAGEKARRSEDWDVFSAEDGPPPKEQGEPTDRDFSVFNGDDSADDNAWMRDHLKALAIDRGFGEDTAFFGAAGSAGTAMPVELRSVMFSTDNGSVSPAGQRPPRSRTPPQRSLHHSYNSAAAKQPRPDSAGPETAFSGTATHRSLFGTATTVKGPRTPGATSNGQSPLVSSPEDADNALEAIGYKALEDPFQPAGGGKQQQTVNPFGPAAARRKSDAGTPDQPVADVQVNHSKRYKPTRNKTGGVAYEI